MKKILICGGNGFIGHHLARKLKKEGSWVRVVDIKEYEYGELDFCDENLILDLRIKENCEKALQLENDEKFDEVYQLACDMGGAGFVFTGDNDFEIMHNSALININIANLHERYKKLFYSSSACAYPEEIQLETDNPGLRESDAYPANPDSEYGWEKIFSERLYLNLIKNKGVPVRIARFHNVFGQEGTWKGGREKAPAAVCRKVAEVEDGGEIEIWGDGEQTRSFLYIDECLEGVERLMESDFTSPVNIGSDEIISINNLVKMAAEISGKEIKIKHIPGPLGVRGRNSNNDLIKEKLGWAPSRPLKEGLTKTYKWIEQETLKIK